MIRLDMKKYNMILTGKQLSGKFDKNEYLTGEEILPSNQRQIIEQACIFPFRKSFGKTNKND